MTNERLENIENDLTEVKSNQQKLVFDVEQLKTDVRVLKTDVKELKVGQRDLARRLDSNMDTLKFMVNFLNERDREMRAFIEMKFEEQQSRMEVHAEEILSNKRRISKLEAS